MRYQLQVARRRDLEIVHELSVGAPERDSDTGPEVGAWLGVVCAASSQIWVAVEPNGQPAGLFGVVPLPDDPAIGQVWVLLLESFSQREEDFGAVLRLVTDEMLYEYTELQNKVSAGKGWAIRSMCAIGFRAEPPVSHPETGEWYCRLWLAADERSLPGGAASIN